MMSNKSNGFCAMGLTLLMASVAQAGTTYWNTAADLATFTPKAAGDMLSLQPKAATVTWTLSADKDLSTCNLELAPYCNGNAATPGAVIFDMAAGGDHTLKLFGFRTRPTDAVSTNVSVVGGTLDFSLSPNGTIILLGSNDSANGRTLNAVYDATRIYHPTNGYLHSGLTQSTLCLKNGASVELAAKSPFGLVSYVYDKTSGLCTQGGEIRFESGSKLLSSQAALVVDFCRANTGSTKADIAEFVGSERTSTPLRFTGAGSGFNTLTIQSGTACRGQTVILSDHAAGVCGGDGFVLGTNGSGYGKETELIVTDHAVMTNRAGLTIGTVAGNDGCRVTVADGAELVASAKDDGTYNKNVYIGYRANDCSLVVSNGTVKAVAIYFGYIGSPYNTVTGGLLKVVGPNARIEPLSALAAPFYASGQTVLFDNAAVNGDLKLQFWNNNVLPESGAGFAGPSNVTFRIENESTLRLTSLLLGRSGSGTTKSTMPVSCDGARVVVGSGSTLTLSERFVHSGSDSAFLVSNGTVRIQSTAGFYVAVSNDFTSHAVSDNKVAFRGAAPRIDCSADASGQSIRAAIDFGSAAVEFDVSEAPVSGYQDPVLEASSIAFQDGKISLSGVEAYRQRLIAANVSATDLVLAKAGASTSLTVYDPNVAAINAELEKTVPGCKLIENPTGRDGELVLRFTNSRTTYLVPSGTAGTSAAYPYTTYETAANSFKEAVAAAGPNGTVNVLTGFYDAGSNGINPPCSATIRAVADGSASTPGELTIYQRIFSGTPVVTDNPQINAFVFGGGTCHLTPLSSGNFFTDYFSTQGQWVNCKITFTGESTAFDSSATRFYLGYLAKGTVFRVTDGARGTLSGEIQLGAHESSGNATMIVEDGASVDLGSKPITFSGNSGDNRLVVSNATLQSGSVRVWKAASGFGPNVLRLAGAAPVIAATSDATVQVSSTSRLEFDLSEAPLAGYRTVPLSAGTVNVTEGAELVLSGVAELLARLDAATVTGSRHRLARATRGSASNLIDATVLEAANDALDDINEGRAANRQCSLVKSGSTLVFRMGVPAIIFLVK